MFNPDDCWMVNVWIKIKYQTTKAKAAAEQTAGLGENLSKLLHVLLCRR